MSHNLAIDTKTGEASLYLLKEKAWHGLGQVVESAKTSDEVIKIAHLDWEVEKIPNKIELPNKGLTDSGSFSVVRKDTEAILHSTALAKYTPVQNQEAFKFMDSLVRFAGDITYETAGALGQGEEVFVTTKLPGYIRIAGSDDVIEKYLIWTNSHAGKVLGLYFSDVRVVCANTLSASMKDLKSGVSLKHTANVMNRINEAAQLLGLIKTYNDEFGLMLNKLAKFRVDEKIERNFVNSLLLTPEELKLVGTSDGISIRKQNTINEVISAIHSAPGQDMHQMTAFWLYNGITSYFQNVKSYKSVDRKMTGINLGGEESYLTQRAFDSLVSLMS